MGSIVRERKTAHLVTGVRWSGCGGVRHLPVCHFLHKEPQCTFTFTFFELVVLGDNVCLKKRIS